MKLKTSVSGDNYQPDNESGLGSAINSSHNNSRYTSLEPFRGRQTSPESLPTKSRGHLGMTAQYPIDYKLKYSRKGQIKFNILCRN